TAQREIDERVNEAAQMLGLEELLARRPKQLSGGQRQRVAMGRAIVRRPKVFLFDEPLSNLDAKLRTRMRTELGRLHAQLATTMVYVTHDQVEAMTLADRIVVMHGGVVQQVGTPLELYDRPANRFVAGFIGTPAMNFIDGRLSINGDGHDDEAGLAFVCDGARVELPAALARAAARSAAESVSLGVRPNHLVLCDVEREGVVPATVEVREPLGAEVYLHLDSPVGALTACAPGHSPLRQGDRVGVDLAASTLHLFEGDSDLRIDVEGSNGDDEAREEAA
ncbi:MAG: ATP-binding cassette domain-containing protein, partial [Myxococcales bacterium]|nr:ATP-binding cassette domain-containing protein [Myxococcales bacterium]